MKQNKYGLYLAGIITEEAMLQNTPPSETNQMTPGGTTRMTGENPALGNTTGEENQENQELDELSNQMQTIMGKLLPLIARMTNKEKGFHVLRVIGDAIKSTFPQISDTTIRKATTGDLPTQKDFQN